MHSGPELVGQNVRRLRHAQGLSLVDLGRYAGLAKGTLTQIEAGRGNPTIETLQALARALGATLAELVAEPEDAGPRVVRADDGDPIAQSGLAGRLIHRTHAGTAILELYEWRLAAGAAQHSAAHAPGVTEQVFVLAGEVQTGPEDDPVVLAPRDFVRFSADVPHLYRAVEVRAHALVLMVFPALPAGMPPLRSPEGVVPAALPAATGPSGPVAAPGSRPVLPQPPVRGRRPTTRPAGVASPVRPKPPGPGR